MNRLLNGHRMRGVSHGPQTFASGTSVDRNTYLTLPGGLLRWGVRTEQVAAASQGATTDRSPARYRKSGGYIKASEEECRFLAGWAPRLREAQPLRKGRLQRLTTAAARGGG